jgi:hypothetical protein
MVVAESEAHATACRIEAMHKQLGRRKLQPVWTSHPVPPPAHVAASRLKRSRRAAAPMRREQSRQRGRRADAHMPEHARGTVAARCCLEERPSSPAAATVADRP